MILCKNLLYNFQLFAACQNLFDGMIRFLLVSKKSLLTTHILCADFLLLTKDLYFWVIHQSFFEIFQFHRYELRVTFPLCRKFIHIISEYTPRPLRRTPLVFEGNSQHFNCRFRKNLIFHLMNSGSESFCGIIFINMYFSLKNNFAFIYSRLHIMNCGATFLLSRFQNSLMNIHSPHTETTKFWQQCRMNKIG